MLLEEIEDLLMQDDSGDEAALEADSRAACTTSPATHVFSSAPPRDQESALSNDTNDSDAERNKKKKRKKRTDDDDYVPSDEADDEDESEEVPKRAGATKEQAATRRLTDNDKLLQLVTAVCDPTKLIQNKKIGPKVYLPLRDEIVRKFKAHEKTATKLEQETSKCKKLEAQLAIAKRDLINSNRRIGRLRLYNSHCIDELKRVDSAKYTDEFLVERDFMAFGGRD